MARRKPSNEWDNETVGAGDDGSGWSNAADEENEGANELESDKKTTAPKNGSPGADEEDADELADDNYINEALDDDENLE